MEAKKPFQIVKVAEEGTTEPFLARLMLGVLELRDKMVASSGLRGPALEKRRKDFDTAYQPVLTPLESARKAAKGVVSLVETHVAAVTSGEIVKFQRNAFSIKTSIDSHLHDGVAQFLVQGAIALKNVQGLTLQFDLHIAGFYQKKGAFSRSMAALAACGHGALAGYLEAVRAVWSEDFLARRDALEHASWTLPQATYEQSGLSVAVCEPQVAGVPVSKFVKLGMRRLVAFVETVTVYSIKTALRGLRVVEIPSCYRDPDVPRRFLLLPTPGPSSWRHPKFKVWMPATEWVPKYSDDDFG
jgi:hypothetical protein